MVRSKSSSHDKVIKSIKKINDIYTKFGNREKILKAHRDYKSNTKENKHLKPFYLAFHRLIKLERIVKDNYNDSNLVNNNRRISQDPIPRNTSTISLLSELSTSSQSTSTTTPLTSSSQSTSTTTPLTSPSATPSSSSITSPSSNTLSTSSSTPTNNVSSILSTPNTSSSTSSTTSQVASSNLSSPSSSPIIASSISRLNTNTTSRHISRTRTTRKRNRRNTTSSSTANSSSLRDNNNEQTRQQQPIPLSDLNEQVQQIEQHNLQLNQFCKNCNRYPNNNEENSDIYNFALIPCNTSLIKGRAKFRHVKKNLREMEEFFLCSECNDYVCGENNTSANLLKSSWPAFIWTTLVDKNVRKKYGNKVWQFIPIQWRPWWLTSLRRYTEYSNISLTHPKPLFVDRTLDIEEWNKDIDSMSLARLSSSCNKHMIPNILCPWGCSEYIFKCGYLDIDCIFQRYLPKCIIKLVSSCNKLDLVNHTRDDYIRFDHEYDQWILNPEWKILPSIAFVKGIGPRVLCCRNHDKGSSKMMLHPPRQPNHILPCKYADQLCHAVIKTRTVAPMKAQKFSNSFQMHEQRGCFNGIDTCSITSYRNFALQSLLLGENESRSIKNRADINALVTQLCKEKSIPPQTANNMRENANHIDNNINESNLQYGATFVPLKTAMELQRLTNMKPVKVIWDMRSDNLPDMTVYCKRSFSTLLFPMQKYNDYGISFSTIPKFTSTTINTSKVWILSSLLTRVETLWQYVCNIELKQSGWNGWLLTYLTKKSLTHIAGTKGDDSNPFRMTFMKSINEIVSKVDNSFGDGLFNNIFTGIDSILCVENGIQEVENEIDTNHHDLVIVDNYNIENQENSTPPSIVTINNVQYELKVVISIQYINEFKYNSEIYSRHGHIHNKWWYQNRSDSIPTQSTHLYPTMKYQDRVIILYEKIKVTDCAIEFNREFLNYIGGQSNVACSIHKMPLISSIDRKKKCNCGRKEHYTCPELSCDVCICQQCCDQFDTGQMQYISLNNDNNNININDDRPINIEHGNEPNIDDNTDNNNTTFLDDDDDSEISNIDDYTDNNGRDDLIDRDHFDDFLISGGNPDLSDDEPDNDDDFDNTYVNVMPTTDAGDLAFEVIDNTPKRSINISGHVILNQCGSVLTRKKHEIKASSIHKQFLQRICATSDGKSISLLYPEGMLFPCIFYKMIDGAILGAIPAPLLSESISQFGFASLPEHIRSRITASGYQTGTNPRYISYSYDTMVNLACNHSDTRIALNRGLTTSDDDKNGLSVRGKGDSAMLESIDSKQMVKNLTAAQKYYMMDYFLTFTCNQKKHFGTKPIKEWIDSDKWKKNYAGFYSLTDDEQFEIKTALNQSSASLLLRSWNETCRLFLNYIRKSPSSPFKNVTCMFARHEYQKDVGNLPHIHTMIKIGWDKLSEEEKIFVNDLIRASILEIVRPEEVDRYKEEGLMVDMSDLDDIIKDAKTMLPHKCGPRCQIAVGDNEYRCRKLNYLLMNKPPENTRNTLKDLPNDLSMECLKRLEQIGIIEPLVIHENGFVEPFKSYLEYFHPKRHIPPVSWTHDNNISPVEGKTFAACRSMQNIQKLTQTGGCNRYVVKYLGKIDEQNYVIIYADTHRNGVLVTKRIHLHNTKVSTSKFNEDKMRDNKRESFHSAGRTISIPEMIHNILKYSEVFTDLSFINIATTPLEVRPGLQLKYKKKTQDGTTVGNIINNVRNEINLPQWRQMTENELLVVHDVNTSKISIDKISLFSLRPSELRSLFDQVGNYFRWFFIDYSRMKEEEVRDLIHPNLMTSSWIDSLGYQIKLRKKAIHEVSSFLNSLNIEEDCPEYEMKSIFDMIYIIYSSNNNDHNIDEDVVNHIARHLVYNDDEEEHLPISVFSYIRPTMGTQFILHILLSLGHFSTELDLILQPSIRESLRYAKLIGPNNDDESLQRYSNELLSLFISEQLIYFPNTRQLIDSWIISAGELFDEVIIHDRIPISNMPPVQQTTLFSSIEEKKVEYIRSAKIEVVSAALCELNDAKDRCSIPSREELIMATKGNPIEWDALTELQKSPNQPEQSFVEQKLAIQVCVDAIDKYCNPISSTFVKNVTIRGFAGCGKSWTMEYAVAYALSKGLNVMTTSMMSRRSVFLGGKHIHQLFCLPIGKNLSAHRMAELAICKLMRQPERHNLIMCLDILFLDEIGQLSAELLSVLDIILRKLRNNNIFMGGILVISTMDHTQLQPVEGRPFLLSSHVITCFKMVKLETSVRAADDPALQRIQQIASKHYSLYNEDDDLLVEFRNLISETCTFVDNWNSLEITPSTYRLYGKRLPANDATKQFVDNVRLSIPADQLLEKQSNDVEKNRYSHCDWEPASTSMKEKLDKRVKEPSTLLFFRGAIYEFTYNCDGSFSQSQMAVLYDLPTQENLERFRKINVLIAPPGIHDIEFDPNLSKEEYFNLGYVEVKVGKAPERIQSIGRSLQGQRTQYGLKHRVTSTIHAAMGDTLVRVATQISNDSTKFKLWDKAQVIVALSRTKLGKNVIFVGDKEGTLDSLVELVQKRTQWTDYMETVLNLVTVNSRVNPPVRQMTQSSFPFRICDVSLPQCNTGFVYFLISIRRQSYAYIGETKEIRRRLNQHNSGHGSSSTTPSYLRPFAVMAYICGFDGSRPLRLFIEKKWKEKRDLLISNGNNNIKDWAKSGADAINEINDTSFPNSNKSELRLVLLYKE